MPRPRRSSPRRSAASRSPGSADYATLALAQAILSGVMFLLLAFFKLGFLANFLSKPILVGFVGGLALDILVSQIAKMLGISIDSGGEFVEKLTDLVLGLPTTNLDLAGDLRPSRSPSCCSASATCAPCRGRSSCSSSRRSP